MSKIRFMQVQMTWRSITVKEKEVEFGQGVKKSIIDGNKVQEGCGR